MPLEVHALQEPIVSLSHGPGGGWGGQSQHFETSWLRRCMLGGGLFSMKLTRSKAATPGTSSQTHDSEPIPDQSHSCPRQVRKALKVKPRPRHSRQSHEAGSQPRQMLLGCFWLLSCSTPAIIWKLAVPPAVLGLAKVARWPEALGCLRERCESRQSSPRAPLAGYQPPASKRPAAEAAII